MFKKGTCGLVGLALAIGSLSMAVAQPQAGGGAAQPKAGAPAKQELGKLLRMIYQNPEVRLAFTMKPRLIAAFAFTDDQINQFSQAYEAANPEGAEQAFKQKIQDPNLSKEDRKKLWMERQDQVKAMREELQKKMDEIMTPDQKTLLQKIADASKAAEKALNDALDQSLTADQRQRMEPPLQKKQGEPRTPKA